MRPEIIQPHSQKPIRPIVYQSSNMIYALGFVGAAIYYISTATGFWIGVLGVLRSEEHTSELQSQR